MSSFGRLKSGAFARVFAAAFALSATAVLYGPSATGNEPEKAEPRADAGNGSANKDNRGHVHWAYHGAEGPSEWGRLSPEFAACYMGKLQSPINIAKPAQKELEPLRFNYAPTMLHVLNNGHTIQFNYEKGSTVEVGGKRYQLVQFHMHAPSEHMLNGKRFPLEIHYVHKSDDGKLAVVGVMVKSGKAHNAVRDIWSSMPSVPGEERRNDGLTFNAAGLLPNDRAYVRYEGSLTTPPCSEGVKWHVLAQPIEMSEAQLQQFSRLYRNNSRPVQPVNGREVLAAQ